MSIKENTDAILFFRMGDFYEMFLDDAAIASEILEIALTKRNGVPMCGIPYHAKDSYLYKLIKAGKRVAICEQVEDPKKTKKIVKREIVEIVTPGTLIDNKILDANNPNYVASFYMQEDEIFLAFCDVSTGDLYFASEKYNENKVKAYDALRGELYKTSPKEIIFAESFSQDPVLQDIKLDHESAIFYPVPDFYFNPDYASKAIKNETGVSTLKGYGINEDSFETGVLGALLKYIKDVQMKDIGHIKNISRISKKNFMELGVTSIRNLELLNNLHDGSWKNTLYHVLNDCKTPMGARLLQEWIKRPLINIDAINERLEIVNYFYNENELLKQTQSLLKECPDIERLLTRIHFSKAIPREVVSLSWGITKTHELKELLLNRNDMPESLKKILDEIKDLSQVGNEIQNTLNQDPPSGFDEGGVIRDGVNNELDMLRETSKKGRDYIISLQKREIEKTGITTLKVKYNKIIGYYIEISKGNVKNAPEHYIKKQELVGSTRYTLPELEEYENTILGAKEKIAELELNIYQELCSNILTHFEQIKSTANQIKKIDVLCSFAYSAKDNNYVLPVIDNSYDIKIIDSRHPVVEAFFKGEEFIPNDVDMNNKDKRLLLITGPNMSGKSTYLRQTALIQIMAQIGSFIPASSGKLGIVDKIFTRIGASDSLVRGESTFLVEMTEAAEILNNSTDRSLIIMDEIGRGTSTYDGLSIAWAIVEFLTDERSKRGKTLFATHYHELTALGKERGIQNFQVSVKEWDDKILFLHKVLEGAASKSYGIQVARLAGVPKQVTERAMIILDGLEQSSDSFEKAALIEERLKQGFSKDQFTLFNSVSEDKLKSEISAINVNKLTPVDALNYLNGLVDRVRKNKI